MDYNRNIAHIKAEDGRVYQVLNEDGTDWDEAETRALYFADHPEVADAAEVADLPAEPDQPQPDEPLA